MYPNRSVELVERAIISRRSKGKLPLELTDDRYIGIFRVFYLPPELRDIGASAEMH